MLSQNQVVAVRRAIESTYIGTCDIVQYAKTLADDMTTTFAEAVTHTALACRLSFESNNAVAQTDGAGAVMQTTKVFTTPDITIPAGSKLIITQNGVTTAYQCSSAPNRYNTHQEVTVELFRGWA